MSEKNRELKVASNITVYNLDKNKIVTKSVLHLVHSTCKVLHLTTRSQQLALVNILISPFYMIRPVLAYF